MRRILIVLAVAFAVLLSAQTAEAAFKLRITDSGADKVFGTGDDTSVTVTDDTDGVFGPGPDLDPVAGSIAVVSLVVGDFKVAATGTSKPFLMNTATTAEMDLLALTVVKTGGVGGGTVRIELTDTGFAFAGVPPAVEAGVESKIGGTGTLGSIIKSQASIDTGNVEFGTATLVVTHAPPPLGPGAFADTKKGSFTYPGGPFSITMLDDISLTTVGASVSFDHDVFVNTPAPAGWVLLVSGGLAFLGYRRRKPAVA